MKAPILKYPDTSKRSFVFTGASGQTAAAVSTWEYPDENGYMIEMFTFLQNFQILNLNGVL